MKFVNLNSAFLIGVMALNLGGCASTGEESSKPVSKAPQTSKKAATVQLVTPEAESEFANAMRALNGKKYKTAEKLLKAMTIKHPTLSGPFLNLGILYIQQGDLDAAQVPLERAIEVNPNNSAAYNQLAWVYKENANFKRSEETYLQGLAQTPKDPELNYNLGILYDLILHIPEKALYYYEQYLENIDGEDKRAVMWVKELKRRTN